jgi:hypothetical protein
MEGAAVLRLGQCGAATATSSIVRYRAAIPLAANRAVDAGYLLPEDADVLKAADAASPPVD